MCIGISRFCRPLLCVLVSLICKGMLSYLISLYLMFGLLNGKVCMYVYWHVLVVIIYVWTFMCVQVETCLV